MLGVEGLQSASPLLNPLSSVSDHPTQRSHLRPRFCHRLFQPFSLLASNFHRLLLHGRFRYRLIACPFLHPRVVLYLRLPRAMSRELNRHHVFELGAIALAVIHLGGYPPEFTNIFPTPIPVTLKPHKARKGGRAQLV